MGKDVLVKEGTSFFFLTALPYLLPIGSRANVLA